MIRTDRPSRFSLTAVASKNCIGSAGIISCKNQGTGCSLNAVVDAEFEPAGDCAPDRDPAILTGESTDAGRRRGETGRICARKVA